MKFPCNTHVHVHLFVIIETNGGRDNDGITTEDKKNESELVAEHIREYYQFHRILPPIETNCHPMTSATRHMTITPYGPPLLPVLIHSKDESTKDNDLVEHSHRAEWDVHPENPFANNRKRPSGLCRFYSRAKCAMHNAFRTAVLAVRNLF